MYDAIVDHIFELFERFGSESYGENATQLQHALQVAELACRHGCSAELIAAALLHDVGQLLDDAGNAAERRGIDAHHEVSGATFLGKHFSAGVTEPVRLHVAAKRYLCAVEPSYLDTLSDASRLSLHYQGGPMSALEIGAFEATAFSDNAVKLRRFDDSGKQSERYPPGLAAYQDLLKGLAIR